MSNLLRVGVAAVLLTASAGLALADVKSEIQAVTNKFLKAYKTRDLKAIEKMCTPDFKYKVLNGQVMNLKQSLDMMKAEFSMMPEPAAMTMKVDKVRSRGNIAVAETSGSFKGKMPGPDGKMHVMAGTGKSRQTYVKTAGGWKTKMVEEVSQKMTMDGRPFDPSKMAPVPANATKTAK